MGQTNIPGFQRHRLLKGCFLIEGLPLYVSYHNKTIRLLHQKHNNSVQFLTPYYGHKKMSGILHFCSVSDVTKWLFYCRRLQVRWQCNICFTRAHWRAVGGFMLLNMQRNGARMDQKQRQTQNEDMRGLTHYILIILKFFEDTDSS
jgi:hypothetical protein